MTSQETTEPYEGMRTRQHWKRENAARVLADWVDSGESMTAFTRRHQLSLHRLQWWRAPLSQPLRTTIGDLYRWAMHHRREGWSVRGECAVLTEPYIP
jgi:hypothetical protein